MINRIIRLQQNLLDKKLDSLLVSSSYNIAYLTDFFGFSKTEREGYLLVTHNNIYIFASGLNSEAVAKHINSLCVNVKHTWCDIDLHIGNFGKIALVEISPRMPPTKKVLADILRREKIKRLGFEKQNLSYAEYERFQKSLKTPRGNGRAKRRSSLARQAWRPKDSPEVELIPTDHLIEELRMIKSPEEVAAIEKACTLGDKTFDHILTRIKPGITEKKLAFEIELFIRKSGGEISFPPIVGFGKNSSIPHHVTNDQRPTTNSWVLLDFGVRINNYCSDMTRTIFFGKASKEQRHMYHTVLEAQQKAIEFLNKVQPSSRLNLRAKKIDQVARAYITSQGYPTIPHSLGHGIGLEVHEPPRLATNSNDTLKPGMVFSIEPGIYLPGIGGIRIEDLIVLEKTGPRFLTKAKRDLIEL